MVCPIKMQISTHGFLISISRSVLQKCGFSHLETTTVLSDISISQSVLQKCGFLHMETPTVLSDFVFL